MRVVHFFFLPFLPFIFLLTGRRCNQMWKKRLSSNNTWTELHNILIYQLVAKALRSLSFSCPKRQRSLQIVSVIHSSVFSLFKVLPCFWDGDWTTAGPIYCRVKAPACPVVNLSSEAHRQEVTLSPTAQKRVEEVSRFSNTSFKSTTVNHLYYMNMSPKTNVITRRLILHL